MKCCDLTPGKLRVPFVIQARSNTADDMGGNVVAWVNVALGMAMVKDVSASERYYAQRIEANVTHKAYIRYNSSITSDMRILLAGEMYQIKGVTNIELKNKWLELQVQSGVQS